MKVSIMKAGIDPSIIKLKTPKWILRNARVGSKGFKDYMMKLLKNFYPLRSKKDIFPIKMLKGRAIKDTSRYFQYIRVEKQIKRQWRSYSDITLETVGVEHPGGILKEQ